VHWHELAVLSDPSVFQLSDHPVTIPASHRQGVPIFQTLCVGLQSEFSFGPYSRDSFQDFLRTRYGSVICTGLPGNTASSSIFPSFSLRRHALHDIVRLPHRISLGLHACVLLRWPPGFPHPAAHNLMHSQPLAAHAIRLQGEHLFSEPERRLAQ
jgi:hypothetical protein